MDIAGLVRRIIRFIIEYGLFIIILYIGFCIYVEVFNVAVEDYLSSSMWKYRSVWLGKGDYDLFGYTIEYQLEGYSDYSFYYVHWGNNMLDGVMPYCDEFGYIKLDGVTNRNGLYIFPPLYSMLYAAGIMLGMDNCGIGLILTFFAYITVFPIYGLAKEFSKNRHVAEVAALTYFLNVSILYHIVFLWTNPSPFIFFFFSGFYMLVRGKRDTGTLLIVIAALFKQTAWFLGFPLVVYLLMTRRSSKSEQGVDNELENDVNDASDDVDEKTPGRLNEFMKTVQNTIDIRGFATSVLLVVVFVGAIMYPFLIAQPQIFINLSLASGGFPLESFTAFPGYGSPMRFQVLPVAAGLPWLAEIMDYLVFNGIFIIGGVMLFFGLMLLTKKDSDKKTVYLRRLLFLTMCLMLWVHLAGPRGVYKYYFTLFAPFFSIFSSSQMINSSDEHVPFSLSMLWLPLLLSTVIIVLDRNIYLFAVLLILIGYALSSQIGLLWKVIKSPGRFVVDRIAPPLKERTARLSVAYQRMKILIYPEMNKGIDSELSPTQTVDTTS